MKKRYILLISFLVHIFYVYAGYYIRSYCFDFLAYLDLDYKFTDGWLVSFILSFLCLLASIVLFCFRPRYILIRSALIIFFIFGMVVLAFSQPCILGAFVWQYILVFPYLTIVSWAAVRELEFYN